MLEREYGFKAAQVIVGHARESLITLSYVEADHALAEEVMLKMG